jgi:hypothetical protein
VGAQALNPGENPLRGMEGELLDIAANLSPGTSREVDFALCGVPITYNVKREELTCQGKTAPLKLADGHLRLRMLVDRTSIDIFGNDGQMYMPMGMIVPQDNRSLVIDVKGGQAWVNTLEVYKLKSAWSH